MKRTHGESKTRLYRLWCHIKWRCLNKNCKQYPDYGGRGIKICDGWLNSYESFRDWALANGYSDELTIDRIDVNGNYTPSNCRWVDNKTQARNKRRTIYVRVNGESKTLSELAEQLGVSYYTLHKRIRYLGYPPEGNAVSAAIRHPTYSKEIIAFNGEEHSLSEWARIVKIPYDTLRYRIHKLHFPIERALTEPLKKMKNNRR